MLAPIALFTYNRPDHLRKTIDSLAKNTLAKESDLFIFSDGARHSLDEGGWSEKEKVEQVRKYIHTITGFKSVIIRESETNKGLAASIIFGVTELVHTYGKVIVLEDDLITSPHFLSFMNKGLDMYETENTVGSIHGYVYPHTGELSETFFLKHTSSWGWATWKRSWDLFEKDGTKLLAELNTKNKLKEFNFGNTYDFSGMLQRQIDGKNNSWAIRWYASLFLNDKLSLYPGISLVQNIGQDGSGTNMKGSGKYYVRIAEKEPELYKILANKNELAAKSISNFFNSLKPSLMRRIIRKLKTIIKK